MQRPQITKEEIASAILELQELSNDNVERKGNGVFLTRFEVEGALMQEVREFQEAIDKRQSDSKVISELLDIAAVAIWAAASINHLHKGEQYK